MRQAIPNVLTTFRLIIAPLGAAAIWRSYTWSLSHDVPVWLGEPALIVSGLATFGAAAFILAALTDWLDGALARRWKVESAYGRVMDPLADKLLVASYLLTYIAILDAPLDLVVPVGAILVRDAVITILRMTSSAPAAETLPVSPLAKLKTAIELVVVGIPLLAAPMGWLQSDVFLAVWLSGLWVAASLSLLTGLRYLLRTRS